MPKFAANLSMLFTEAPFLERFKLAANSGFEFVEFLFPYAYTPEQLKQLLEQHQLKQVLFNLPPGNWDDGERGIACLPGREGEFKTGLDIAIKYAEVLGVKQLNCLAGLRPNGRTDTELRETLCRNISYAAERLKQHDITLMLEPINSKIDMPMFYLDTLDKTKKIINDVNYSNLKIQFDIYHMQVMQGDIIRSLETNISHIGHIQFADNPGRHEPGTGELNFDHIFQAIDRLNYTDWVSAEYLPIKNTLSSLDWFQT